MALTLAKGFPIVPIAPKHTAVRLDRDGLYIRQATTINALYHLFLARCKIDNR